MPRIKFYNTKTKAWEYADKSTGSDGNVDLTGYATEEYVDSKIEEASVVPAPTTSDEGKFLRVINGVIVWQALPQAEEALF